MTIPPRFRPYCESQGINLLPDDVRFIEKCLDKTHRDEHREVLRKYCRIWADEMKVSQNENFGRYKANVFLRERNG